jgi:hypothetical protein
MAIATDQLLKSVPSEEAIRARLAEIARESQTLKRLLKVSREVRGIAVARRRPGGAFGDLEPTNNLQAGDVTS